MADPHTVGNGVYRFDDLKKRAGKGDAGAFWR